MRQLLIFLVILLMPCGWALTLEQILRLHEAKVSEAIIVQVIATNKITFSVTTDTILLLKRKGVSDNIILALMNKGVSKVPSCDSRLTPRPADQPSKRKLTPFDRFFLAPYYSHEYGWPEPNYDSPQDILEQGLYYESPDSYPNARYERRFGLDYSCQPRNNRGTVWVSPFSILVPKQSRVRAYYRQPEPAEEEGSDENESEPAETETEPLPVKLPK